MNVRAVVCGQHPKGLLGFASLLGDVGKDYSKWWALADVQKNENKMDDRKYNQ